MRCLQRSSVRAWPYWGWLLLLCTTIEPSEVTAARRSVRSSRGDQDPWQLQSSGFSGPTAQALAQFAEGPLNGNPAKWRHTHEDYVKWVEVMEKAGKPWQFVFYGDATVDALRGTYLNSNRSNSDLKAKFWDSYFESLNAAWFGIAEDGVKQLAYRLLDGEFPKKQLPSVVVLAIGNRDLLPPRCNRAESEVVKEGWLRIIEFIREQGPSAHILALGHLIETRLLPDICTELMREVDSYLENLGSTMDHVHYVELQGLIPSVLQGVTAEDQSLLKKVTFPQEDSAADVEHYVQDSSQDANWAMEVVSEHVSEVVTEVLGQKDPSPPAGSGKTMLANAVDTRTRTSRTTRIRGSSGFVRMQVRREVMSEPQYPRILYTISDTVSKEEAFLHDDT